MKSLIICVLLLFFALYKNSLALNDVVVPFSYRDIAMKKDVMKRVL